MGLFYLRTSFWAGYSDWKVLLVLCMATMDGSFADTGKWQVTSRSQTWNSTVNYKAWTTWNCNLSFENRRRITSKPSIDTPLNLRKRYYLNMIPRQDWLAQMVKHLLRKKLFSKDCGSKQHLAGIFSHEFFSKQESFWICHEWRFCSIPNKPAVWKRM